MDNKWRNDLDILIEENLKQIIAETKEFDSAIKKSKDPGKAQIWVAIALLNHKVKSLEYDNIKHEKKIPKDELDKILKSIESL